MLVVCPECGAGARDGAPFCLNCGTALGVDDTRQVPRVEEPTDEAGGAPAGLRDCPNCDAPNSEHRARCGRCGADLATGHVPEPSRRARPRPASIDDGGPDTGPLAIQRRRRVRPAIVVLGLGVLVGAAIGGLAAAEVGPFATDPVAPTATFDPGVYVGQPRPLDVERVLASSTHAPQGDNRYEASQMIDDDLATAWNSDGAQRPRGVGESLRFELEQPAWVSGLVIANGYQKDDRAFVANARLQRVRVSFGGTEVFDVSVLDQGGRQVVDLPAPVLATEVTIVVLETYGGQTYEDLAISEVELRGWPAVGQDLQLITPADTQRDPVR